MVISCLSWDSTAGNFCEPQVYQVRKWDDNAHIDLNNVINLNISTAIPAVLRTCTYQGENCHFERLFVRNIACRIARNERCLAETTLEMTIRWDSGNCWYIYPTIYAKTYALCDLSGWACPPKLSRIICWHRAMLKRHQEISLAFYNSILDIRFCDLVLQGLIFFCGSSCK